MANKFWQGDKSLDSKPKDQVSKTKAQRNRIQWEGDQRSLQEWADHGFMSGAEGDDVPLSDDE